MWSLYPLTTLILSTAFPYQQIRKLAAWPSIVNLQLFLSGDKQSLTNYHRPPVLHKYDHINSASDPKQAWFPYALQSASMMHSTLAMAAVMWRTEFSALSSRIRFEGIRQKGEAMREIRMRLANAHCKIDNDITNSLISTIATLSITEIHDNNFEAADTHLRCVSNLCRLRGDVNSFKDDFILCKSISLADVISAVALGRPLIFPLMDATQPNSFIEPTLEEGQHTSFGLPVNNRVQGHTGIFDHLGQILTSHHSHMVTPEAMTASLNDVDASILKYLYQDHTDGSDDMKRSHALVHAAHVFMYATLRQVSPRSPLLRRLCKRLRENIWRDRSEKQLWTDSMTALLWAAFVGLLGTGEMTESCSEGRWFFELYQTTLCQLAQETFLEVLFSAYLWDESHCQPLLTWLKGRSGFVVGHEPGLSVAPYETRIQ
ncbi:hypothetical protein F5Y15DRAFT_150098 [Xylariaceae sp. FL0016]|nr:hypothetical protein F5Y15DRAFT_150098 [Xylariaceae sp. FL0016]